MRKNSKRFAKTVFFWGIFKDAPSRPYMWMLSILRIGRFDESTAGLITSVFVHMVFSDRVGDKVFHRRSHYYESLLTASLSEVLRFSCHSSLPIWVMSNPFFTKYDLNA